MNGLLIQWGNYSGHTFNKNFYIDYSEIPSVFCYINSNSEDGNVLYQARMTSVSKTSFKVTNFRFIGTSVADSSARSSWFAIGY